MPVKNLKELLNRMGPKLVKGHFVFCAVEEEQLQDLKPLLIFREEEGVTVVVKKEEADSSSLEYSAVWGLITLTVHSDLEAIGFLAAMTKGLADAGIGVNVVSACYHDHLFVPLGKAKQAMEILAKLSSGSE